MNVRLLPFVIAIHLMTGFVFSQSPLRSSDSSASQKALESISHLNRSVSTKYLLYLPADYSTENHPLPVILYLHGGSIRGDDVEKIRTLGLPHRLESEPSFPFIVISPLCPSGEIWTDSDAVMGVLNEVMAKYPADRHRVYLTGHSMGGRGALYFAFKYPQRFAAVVAMSAVSPITDWALQLSKTPIWYMHGVKDELAPIADADTLVSAIRAVGNDIRYTRMDNAGHSSFLKRYDESDWYQWLLQHRR